MFGRYPALNRPIYILTLCAAVTLGFGLRIWNARTAYVHFDEIHYSTDVEWCHAPLSDEARSGFLRRHTHDHPKLEPTIGTLTRWADQPPPHIATGHPTLHARIVGGLRCAFTEARPLPPSVLVREVRIFNAAFDSLTIALLAPLVAAIGGTASAGLLAAWLYAVFPAAATYGSLAYLDPLLSPLFVGLLLVLAHAKRDARLWLAAGALSALLISTKPTGLLVLFVVPMIGRFWCRAGRRELAVWLAGLVAVVSALGNPFDYLQGVFDPVDPSAEVPLNPFETLRVHFVYLVNFARHYWLGFAQHGRPLADVLARAHYVVGPAFFGLFAASAIYCAATRRRAQALFCLLPVVPAIILFPPSNGLWRFQILYPLVCASIALTIANGGTRSRSAFAAIAVICASIAFTPLLPEAGTGNVALQKMIFRNPDVPQQRRLFNPLRGRPFEIELPAGSEMEHTLWLPPGTYRVSVKTGGDVVAAIDGEEVSTAVQQHFAVEGWIHRLRLSSTNGGSIQRLAILSAG